MSKTTRQWVYSKPLDNGKLGPQHFDLREIPLPEPKDGEALVRVKLINIHCNTRMRLYTGAVALGDTNGSNYGCAEVIESCSPAFQKGDLIACQAGWQEYQVISTEAGPIGHGAATELTKALNGTNSPFTYKYRAAVVKMWAEEVLIEMLGTSGMTAYFGMRECGPLMPADRVAVAGATGSVGSIVAQLAKAAGCYVVGFAGGKDGCGWVVENLGIDGCIDYRAADFQNQLRRAFPNGIDVFSDGIGGSLTETVVEEINPNGRLFAYGGAAAMYEDRFGAEREGSDIRKFFGISDKVEAVLKGNNIKADAFMGHLFYHERLKAEDDLSRLMLARKLKPIYNVVEGFANLPQAIIGLYENPRRGKLQVRF